MDNYDVSRFGPMIPDHIMEDLLFRFLNNIPENEKNSEIRVCFQIEQAHWFYVDFYCASTTDHPDCKKIGFREFVRQVFYKCPYLYKWKIKVDNIIEDFRQYKSNVPTYGVILLDSTLNYVLLVQGYFASKDSWGFPKGKVNENEVPIQCAIREVLEEVGYDATDKVVTRKRPLQCFLNDTLIRLYIATDVPMDFKFQPHLRKEIRKISWFSVWDLPAHKYDDKGCARLGLTPNRFYTVTPFVNDIRKFIQKERPKRLKPKITILRKDSSAFQPVIPRTQSQRSQLNLCSARLERDIAAPSSSSCFYGSQAALTSSAQIYDSKESSSENEGDKLFKPLTIQSEPRMVSSSFTGQSFLENFIKSSQTPIKSDTKPLKVSENLSFGITPKSRRSKDIKQPKPMHSSLIIKVYEAPPESPPTEQQPTSPVMNKSSRSKSFNPALDPIQASTSGLQQQHKYSVGAVGELVNESQRSKLRQSKADKGGSQVKVKEKKQNRTPVHNAQSHNQGISVDISQLFSQIQENIASVNNKNGVETPVSNRLPNITTPLSHRSSKKRAKPVDSLSTRISEISLDNEVGRTSPATAIAMSIARQDAQEAKFSIHLCEAWKNFKLDLSRPIVPSW